MTPHIFKSGIYKGAWCCCAKVRGQLRRVYVPAPAALIVYGTSPLDAYNKWKDHHVGSA